MKLALHWRILIGLLAGIILGLVLNSCGGAIWSALGVNDPAAYLSAAPPPAGEADPNASAGIGAAAARLLIQLNELVARLFLNALRFIAVPIILFSLVVAVGGITDMRRLGRVGARTAALFATTLLISILIGLTIANVVRPGNAIPGETRDQIAASQAGAIASRVQAAGTTSMWDYLASLIPVNPFEALARADMMQVVVFAVVLGLALTLIPRERAGPVLAVFDGLTDAILALVGVIMRAAPVGAFALITPVVADLGLGLLQALLAYCLCVIGGLLVILFVLYPAVLRILTPMPVGRFFRGMAPALLVAFTSSSSAATLPVTIQRVRDKLGIPEDVTSFVCSLGTTINMDGTALMQSIAAIFIAQLYGVDLTIGQQAVIMLTASLAALGSPGIPSGSIVMLIVVLQSVKLPVEGVGIVLAVDRILDMCRTVINVAGDALACVVVAHTEGELPAAPASAAAPESPAGD